MRRIQSWWAGLDEHDRWYFSLGAGLFFAIVLVWAGFWAGLRYAYGAVEDAAEFGDMFGGVNALFSGLAFAGVIIAILLQREELRLQRKELEDTRAELRRSADAQHAAIALQQEQYTLAWLQKQPRLMSGERSLNNIDAYEIDLRNTGPGSLRNVQVEPSEDPPRYAFGINAEWVPEGGTLTIAIRPHPGPKETIQFTVLYNDDDGDACRMSCEARPRSAQPFRVLRKFPIEGF